jgi:hypothetical protein
MGSDQSKCNVISCKNKQINNDSTRKYCIDHSCHWSKCNELRTSKADYCVFHKCHSDTPVYCINKSAIAGYCTGCYMQVVKSKSTSSMQGPLK